MKLIKFSFLILLLFSSKISVGQVKIDTIVSPTKDTDSWNINFPLVQTGNITVDSMINITILQQTFYTDISNPDISKATFSDEEFDQIAYSDFTITYNKNNIISLIIYAEGCGAYCTQWVSYFNFSTLTGQSISFKEVADSERLKKQIVKQIENEYRNYNKELVIAYEKWNDIDSIEYQSIKDNYQECEEKFEIQYFSLTEDAVIIYDKCYLPHYQKPYTLFPEISLQYKVIRAYLVLDL